MPKQIEIPASELRVGDKIINYGVVKADGGRTADGLLSFFIDGYYHYFKPVRILTIERHEPVVVVERWLPINPNLGHPTLEMAREYAEGRPIERLTFHDGVLVSSEVVR